MSNTTCTICNKASSQRCKQCLSTTYCSQTCQRADWPAHKLLCTQFPAFQSRPDPSMRRAIFFSENEPIVKFVWVKATCDESDEDGPSETVDLKSYFSDTAGLEPQFRRVGNGRPLNVNVNALRDNRRLKSTIDIRHRDTFLIDGSKVNQGVLAVTKGKGHEWRGPMVALKEKKKRGVYDPYSFYDDIGMEDFRDVVDYLTGYGEQGRGWWVPGKDPE